MTTMVTRTPGPRTEPTPVRAPSRRERLLLPAIGTLGVVLTAIGLSGVGDAPDPHDPAAAVTTHFVASHYDVLVAAPLGYLGATAVVGFVIALAARFRRGASLAVASVMGSSGVVVGLYLAGLHVVYTTLAYQVAASSPEAAKALFVATILAVPLWGLAVAVLVGAAAYGAWRSGAMPRWWSVASSTVAALASLAAFSYGDSGFFSPDVQQQVVGNLLFVWVLVTAGTLAVTQGGRRDRRLLAAGPRP